MMLDSRIAFGSYTCGCAPTRTADDVLIAVTGVGSCAHNAKSGSGRDLPLGWVEVFFHYVPREILCRTHGRVQEEIPWARPHCRETHRFEYLVLRYCRIITRQAAAELLRIPASTLSDLLHRLIVHFRQDHSIRSLRVLGVEISYKKGHRPPWCTIWREARWSDRRRQWPRDDR